MPSLCPLWSKLLMREHYLIIVSGLFLVNSDHSCHTAQDEAGCSRPHHHHGNNRFPHMALVIASLQIHDIVPFRRYGFGFIVPIKRQREAHHLLNPSAYPMPQAPDADTRATCRQTSHRIHGYLPHHLSSLRGRCPADPAGSPDPCSAPPD